MRHLPACYDTAFRAGRLLASFALYLYMQSKLQQLKKEVLEQLSKVRDSQSLRDLEVQYLGRKGKLTKILRRYKDEIF